MSDGYKNGAFSLGAVVGAGLALNLFAWVSYYSKQKADKAPQASSDQDSDKVVSYWDGLVGTFISPSDTLAQWIMAVFTIAVVFLVWRTLIATQEMVRDTRDIGQKQTRAYLHCKTVTVQRVAAGKYISHVEIHNFGQTPAKKMIVWFGCWIEQYPLQEKLKGPSQQESSAFSVHDMPPRSSHNLIIPLGRILSEYDISEIEAERCAVYVWGEAAYLDIFGKERSSKFVYYRTGPLANWDGRVMPYREGNESD